MRMFKSWRYGFGFMCGGCALAAALVVGCQSQPRQAKQAKGYQAPTPPQHAEETEAPIDTTAHAERLAEAMARSQAEADAAEQGPPIEWIEPGAEAPAPPQPASKPEVAQAATQAESESEAKAEAEPVAAQKRAQAPSKPAEQTLDRRELIDALLAAIRDSDDPALERALDASLVTLGRAGSEVDPAVLAPLSSAQREQVARFQSLVQLFRHQLVTGTGEVTRRDAEQAIAQMFSAMPLEIRAAALCRKVEGYGVYEPFEGHTFLAGRDNKMIVYVELDNFVPRATDDEHFEVRLEQELALYTDWDGQKVWHSQPREITDRSRNRRRDFFVVQMVTLPARLSVGKYVLKVDITDKHGGSIDAVPLEINIVADPSLVRGDDDHSALIKRLLREEESRPLRDK